MTAASDPRVKELLAALKESRRGHEIGMKPFAADFHRYCADRMAKAIDDVLAYRALAESPSEPEVERVEFGIGGFPGMEGPHLYREGDEDGRSYPRSDGWKFYAERPKAPPTPKEPSNEELAESLRIQAEAGRGCHWHQEKDLLLAASRLRSLPKETRP